MSETVAVLSIVSIAGRIVTVSTKGTQAATGAKLIQAELDWGDANIEAVVTENDIPHEYQDDGEYLIKLLVVDNKRDKSATSELVAISSVPPVQSPPVITSLVPDKGPKGSRVEILGDNFGLIKGQTILTMDNIPMGIESWSNTKIVAIIP